MCVYIYLFLTNQFPSWYVKVNLYAQLLGPLHRGVGVKILPLSMDSTTNQSMHGVKSPKHQNAGFAFFFQVHLRALYCFSAKLEIFLLKISLRNRIHAVQQYELTVHEGQ